MEKFEDIKHNLIWVDYHNNENNKVDLLSFIKSKFKKNKSVETLPSHQEAIDYLNTWSENKNSKSIKNFIIKKSKFQLGDYFEKQYFTPTDTSYRVNDDSHFYQYFAYKKINDKITLVGTALINHYPKSSHQDYIEYFIVNPDYQKSGIGTQMLSSIIENAQHFTHSPETHNLVVYIHEDNEASIRLVNRFGFEQFAYKNPFDEDYYLSTPLYAYTINTKEFENHENSR